MERRSAEILCAGCFARDDGLDRRRWMENARKMGKYILSGPRIGQASFKIVGDVRGKGLMVGMN